MFPLFTKWGRLFCNWFGSNCGRSPTHPDVDHILAIQSGGGRFVCMCFANQRSQIVILCAWYLLSSKVMWSERKTVHRRNENRALHISAHLGMDCQHPSCHAHNKLLCQWVQGSHWTLFKHYVALYLSAQLSKSKSYIIDKKLSHWILLQHLFAKVRMPLLASKKKEKTLNLTSYLIVS